MSNATQMMKGLLEGCLLKIIDAETLYGYAAVERLNRLGFDVNEATVYPILSRLQTKGFLYANSYPSPLGPMRKYYTLTRQGKAYLHEFAGTWQKISGIVDHIMEGNEYEQTR